MSRSPEDNLALLLALAAEERRLRELIVRGEPEPERAPPPSLPPADEARPLRRYLVATGLLVPTKQRGRCPKD